MPITNYIEEVKLGMINDPYTDRPLMLTEKITVCPSCLSLHSLREMESRIFCTECDWSSGAPKKHRHA